MMKRVILCVLVFLGCLGASVAGGSTVLLPFAAVYVAPGGETCTHRGIDVAHPAGEPFASPVAGQVHFAGRVPGPHGTTVLAVTIDSADGLISMLPFASTPLSKGDVVAAGESVGVVAAEGDPSSAASHVHLGLRRGGLYVDPAHLLAPAVTPPNPQPDTVSVPSPASSPHTVPQTSPAPATASAVSPVTTPEAAPIGPGVTVPALSASVAARPLASGGAPAGAAHAAAGVPHAQSDGVPLMPGVTLAAAHRDASERTRVGAAENAASQHLRAPLAVVRSVASHPLGAGASAGALLASIMLLTRRGMTRRIQAIEPVSDRWGKMLQALRTGDTLLGLTSCSGHSAFTDPGPPAQRR